MKKTLMITRYSDHSFGARYQSHHLKLIDYHLNGFNLDRFPRHLRPQMFSRHIRLKTEYLVNKNTVKYGVWAFLAGFEIVEELDHLVKWPKLFKARINEKTTVYTKLLDKKFSITNERFKKEGFFIPESELSNIVDEWQVAY